MKIVIKTNERDEYDEGGSEEMLVTHDDGSNSSIYQREFSNSPEDAFFHRDLNAPSNYISIIEAAHRAGKEGKELIISYEGQSESDD
jgi:hypothetical protein